MLVSAVQQSEYTYVYAHMPLFWINMVYRYKEANSLSAPACQIRRIWALQSNLPSGGYLCNYILWQVLLTNLRSQES